MFHPVLVIALLEVFTAVGAAALLALPGCQRRDLRQIQQAAQLKGFHQVGIEYPRFVIDMQVAMKALAQFRQIVQALAQGIVSAEDADIVHHGGLHLGAQIARAR